MNRLLLLIALLGFGLGCSTKPVIKHQKHPETKPVETRTKSEAATLFEGQCIRDLEEALGRLQPLEAGHDPQEIAGPATVLEPINDLWIVLDRLSGSSNLYRNVHPDPDVVKVAEWCEQETQKIITRVQLSRPLCDKVRKIDLAREDRTTQRFVRNMLRDFRRAGVDQYPQTREKIQRIQEELVIIGQQFNRNISADVRAISLDSEEELSGLPQDYLQSHRPGSDGKIAVTTDYPDYLPFLSYAKSDRRRQELYKAFQNRGWPQNEEVLERLLGKRYELARTLGYDNWAQYITEDKMIGNSVSAQAFIDQVSHLAEARSKSDYKVLLARLHAEEPAGSEVQDWQKAYLEEQVKRDTYRFDSQALRPYFTYEKVKHGLMDLTSRMFGITYHPIQVPTWHPSVEAYEVREGQEILGRFYLDMHPRANKFKHAAAFPLRAGLDRRQPPEAALICNFPGGDSGPGYLDHGSVRTFFHEFGHLLHHLFGGRQRWVAQSGISTEWDFVEAPSQVLEEWAYDPATLNLFAHNEQGERIPEALMASMNKARNFGKGVSVRHQMFYAAMSLQFYNRNPQGLDTTDLMKAIQSRYSLFRYVDDTHQQASFGHLDGTSATYYSYMWSLVIAKDLLSKFQKEGMLSPEVATQFRKTILERGGSEEASALIHEFLGRDYNLQAFSRWINAS